MHSSKSEHLSFGRDYERDVNQFRSILNPPIKGSSTHRGQSSNPLDFMLDGLGYLFRSGPPAMIDEFHVRDTAG
jgi:hypothetical protein